MKWRSIMEGKGLGKRINMVKKDYGFTADTLSELYNINATYLRQIEGGTKIPSLPVFINICNVLKIPPDYLLWDALEDNRVSKIQELEELWESTSPSQQEIAVAMIWGGYWRAGKVRKASRVIGWSLTDIH